jgi:hypothetical protein
VGEEWQTFFGRAVDGIPEELHPLAEEARKYKSAEEFVSNYDGGVILNRDAVNNWISGGPNNVERLSKLLTPQGKQFVKDMGLPGGLSKKCGKGNKQRRLLDDDDVFRLTPPTMFSPLAGLWCQSLR